MFAKGSVAGQIKSIDRTREPQPKKLAGFKQASACRDIPIKASQLSPVSREETRGVGHRTEMTFPRNDPHEVLVKQIQEALTALGWCVEPMGQELFSATMQENLRNCALPDGRPLPFRWLPDLLATRPPHAYFIDAKSSETWRQTGNHALERNALATALNWTAIWEMDVWYIFTDGSGTTARQLAKPSAKWPGPQRGNGSGTPFWLFPVGLTTPWEQLPFTNPPSTPKLYPSPDLDTQLPANFCLRHPTAN